MKYIEWKGMLEPMLSHVRFASSEGPSLNDEVYALGTQSETVMLGPVVCHHQDGDEMIQTIQLPRLAWTNNPYYHLKTFLGCTMVSYKHRVLMADSIIWSDGITWVSVTQKKSAVQTMRTTFSWPSVETTIADFVHKCITCKWSKLYGGKQDYGLLSIITRKVVNPFGTAHVES